MQGFALIFTKETHKKGVFNSHIMEENPNTRGNWVTSDALNLFSGLFRQWDHMGDARKLLTAA